MRALWRGTILNDQAITTAVTNSQSKTIILREMPSVVIAVCVFTHGSGGTTTKVWVQSTGERYANTNAFTDICNFSFAQQSGAKGMEIARTTTSTVTTMSGVGGGPHTITDDTAVGPVGHAFRVQWTTTGTYADSTQFDVDLICLR
jgi:hypothetical protein